MKTQWMVETHGDPIGAVREFIKAVWLKGELDGLVVSLSGNGVPRSKPYILASPQELDKVNPFKPLMEVNAAKYLPDLLRKVPEAHLGVIVRPCEMRALIEMTKREAFVPEGLLTICIDCLGTYPVQDFDWRARRKGSARDLTSEALHFARAGGIAAYRYRSACQMCPSPHAHGGHLNLGVLGLPIRQHLLVQTRDAITAEWLQMDHIADRTASPAIVAQYERSTAKLVARNARTRERITHGLSEVLPSDVDTLIQQFVTCGACRECLDSCPICAVDYPRQDSEGKLLREDVKRWMMSCAGCGMCEQSCPHHLPLSAIFHHIKAQLVEPYNYTPGRSVEEPLPLM